MHYSCLIQRNQWSLINSLHTGIMHSYVSYNILIYNSDIQSYDAADDRLNILDQISTVIRSNCIYYMRQISKCVLFDNEFFFTLSHIFLKQNITFQISSYLTNINLHLNKICIALF